MKPLLTVGPRLTLIYQQTYITHMLPTLLDCCMHKLGGPCLTGQCVSVFLMELVEIQISMLGSRVFYLTVFLLSMKY